MTPSDITKKVEWRDLVKLNFTEKVIENSITLPWLASALILSYYELYWWVIPCSFFFFLTAFRQVHNGFHQALGTSKFITQLTLHIHSITMLTSLHAVKFNHLRHHKHCMGEEDYEGHSAKLTWWRAILYGPIHIYMIHKTTFLLGSPTYKKRTLLELVAILLYLTIIIFFKIKFLLYFSFLMLLGECLSAFFAVWTVHHDCEEQTIARTQRKSWKNRISYNMFYHLEHHLFPAIPTIKLPELAKRIDKIVPNLVKKETF